MLSGILETTLDPFGLPLRKQFLCWYRFVCHRQTNVQQSIGMGAFEWNSAGRKHAFDLEFHLQTTKIIGFADSGLQRTDFFLTGPFVSLRAGRFFIMIGCHAFLSGQYERPAFLDTAC